MVWHDAAMARVPTTVVLVHGAWHGAWCWAPLQAALDRRGVPSYAIDLPGHGASTLPLNDLYGDAAHVAHTLRSLDRNVVLVGHSYGGAVVTEAASAADIGDRVAHLVYLTAFALDADESVMDVITSTHRDVLLGGAMLPHGDGATVLDPSLTAAALYGSCPSWAVDAALPRLSPHSMASFGQPVTGSPRTHLPSTYAECTLDQAIHIDHQRVMSARCDTVVTWQTDHSPFISMVDATADLLQQIAGRQ